jgi:Ca2+-binding EF-hand superfamily protein
MGLVKSEYRAGVYDAQHFKDHTLDGDERRQREQAAAQQVLLQAIRARRTVFGRTLRDPRAVFQAIDRDGSGKVSPDELANGLQRLGLGLTKLQSEDLARSLDVDGDGEIGWQELAGFLGDAEAAAEASGAGEAQAAAPAPAPPPAGAPALRIRFDASGGYTFQQIDSSEVRRAAPAAADATMDRTSLGFFSAQGLLEMPSKQARDELFRRMDPNGNGQLSMNEYVDGLVVLLPQFGNKEAVRRAFVASDLDQSGTVSRREFRLLLHYTIFFHKKAATFQRIDTNADGRVDL